MMTPRYIIEVNEMLDDLTNFFNDLNSHHMIVGGIAGTPLLKTILDTSTAYTSFDKVLIVEGCTDLVYMKHTNQKIVNHIPWRNLFVDKFDALCLHDPFSLQRTTVNKPVKKYIDTDYMNMYNHCLYSSAQN